MTTERRADVDDTELCGDVTGEPYAFEVECDLPRDHEGDHHAVVTWPQRQPREPGEPSAMERMLQGIYAPLIERQLGIRSVVGGSTVLPAESHLAEIVDRPAGYEGGPYGTYLEYGREPEA